jgi:hypothetical protein
MIMLALTVLTVIGCSVVFVSPSLLPFGGDKVEPVPIALLSTPTTRPTIPVTDTPVPPPPTWTPQPSPTEPPTNTPRPTVPTRTPRPTIALTLPPTVTSTPTATRYPYPFKLSEDGVVFQPYFFSSTCAWLGIAGEVVDQQGEPVNGISVVLNGGGFQNVVTQSGSRPDYAPSGWEHFLDGQVKEGVFTIQLWHNGQPVSESVEVRTKKDCRANLAYLVFQIVWEGYVP